MFTPDFSEFTFGYAFTSNLINSLSPGVVGVPIFPSLSSEGKEEGGYDVKIPRRVSPLFFQFKLPQIVTRKSSKYPPHYPIPYYRMHIIPGLKSKQHQSLLKHEKMGREVYYVCPQFDRNEILSQLFIGGDVPNDCAYFRPSDIGSLDDNSHFVSYNEFTDEAWLYSNPKRIKKNNIELLFDHINNAVKDAPVVEEKNEYLIKLCNELVDSIMIPIPFEEKIEYEDDKEHDDYLDYEDKGIEHSQLFEKEIKKERFKLTEATLTKLKDLPPFERLIHISHFYLNVQVILVGEN